MHLLLIEDSEKLQRHLQSGLQKLGYEVDVSGNGQAGLWQAQNRNYDAIILDLMLPGLDGLSLLSQLRKHGNQSCVLILTARDKVPDRVQGLRLGADDYLVKPFSFDELVARLEALLRRRFAMRGTRITFADLTLDTSARTVFRNSHPLELTTREYLLLEFFAKHPDRVHTRTDIEAHIRDNASEVSSNVVDAAVYSLRRKIDLPGKPSLIRTRRGMGYLFTSNPESACPSDDE